MAIFLNDDIECRKSEPLDTRVRVPAQADLIALNPLYNYIGMLVITLDTLGVYQLTVNDGTTASDWELKTFYTDALVNTFLTDGSVSSVVFGTDTSLTWNATDFTLDMPLNGVTVQLGQETVARILNKTGSTLNNGKVVRVTGAQGNRMTAALADNSSDATSGTILGIMTQDVANNQQGFATTVGLVRDIDTSAFADGDVLYLGSAGAITNVQPATPLHLITVGYCVRSHATQGSIFSHPQNGYELDELHDVLITSAQNNDVLSWNTAGSYWENVALPAAVDLTTNQSIGGDKTFTGATVAGSLAAYRPVGSEINANADLTQITGNTFYNVNASGVAITIEVDDTSDVLFPIGTEFEFSPIDLTNDVAFSALGAQTINSVDGYLKLDKPFSGTILKKTAVNTWLLIGTLKA